MGGEERWGDAAGEGPWAKVVGVRAVNRLLAPRRERSVPEKWFPPTADGRALGHRRREGAGKNRLYRCLDRLREPKAALEQHLAGRWKDLFNARYELLLYDLTSRYFEGAEDGGPRRRGATRAITGPTANNGCGRRSSTRKAFR